MTKEIERVSEAIESAMSGKSCALISSGDPGIYAMAGLVFDLCREKEISIYPHSFGNQSAFAESSLSIEVVPGIPALCFGASLLGAPLTHDFATISLSDLLTPWETIELRIEAAAKADFAIVLYNPKSKKRNWQLKKAQDIILKHRNKNTPVGIVTNAMRNEQRVEIITLDNLNKAQVGMQTTVFIGNSATTCYMNFMITPRGYLNKYRNRSQGSGVGEQGSRVGEQWPGVDLQQIQTGNGQLVTENWKHPVNPVNPVR